MSEIEKPAESLLSTLRLYSVTPYPPLLFSCSLFVTPFLRSSLVLLPQLQAAANNGSVITKFSPFGKTPIRSANPTSLSCLVFGGAVALGSFMIYDNDLVNGSGVVSAWSILFSIVNFKRGLWSMSLWPKYLIGLGAFNSYMYGRTFVLGSS